jgi:membrane protein
MKVKESWQFLRDVWAAWSEDKAPRLGAALAYYAVFSLAPLLLVAIAIAGAVFGRDAAEGQIVGEIRGLIGDTGATAVEAAVRNAAKPTSSAIASAVGLLVLLFGASGVFGQLQDALNTIWKVKPKPGRGLRGTLEDRFLSFAMVLGIGFLLLVSLVLSAALAAAGKFFGAVLPVPETVLHALNFAVSFAVVTLLFALIYKILPDVRISWRDVWVGAVVTSFLFSIGKLLIGLYLGHSSVGSTYGAAGALVIVLLWMYYSAQILLLGAEFTRVFAKRRGARTAPTPNAERVAADERAKQGMSPPARAPSSTNGRSSPPPPATA